MTELRYNSMEFRLPIEYFPIFYRNHKPSPWTVLKCFSREEILNLVLMLGNEYVNKPAMNILNLMSDKNWWKKYSFLRLDDYLVSHQFDGMYAFHKHCWKYFVMLLLYRHLLVQYIIVINIKLNSIL